MMKKDGEKASIELLKKPVGEGGEGGALVQSLSSSVAEVRKDAGAAGEKSFLNRVVICVS